MSWNALSGLCIQHRYILIHRCCKRMVSSNPALFLHRQSKSGNSVTQRKLTLLSSMRLVFLQCQDADDQENQKQLYLCLQQNKLNPWLCINFLSICCVSSSERYFVKEDFMLPSSTTIHAIPFAP